jgi:hypothetical protein
MRNTRANASNNQQFTLHGINIQEVDLFIYFGSLTTSEGGAEIDVQKQHSYAQHLVYFQKFGYQTRLTCT